MSKNSTLDAFNNNSKSQTQNKQIIYYTFSGQGKCKLVRCQKNKPFFKLYVPKSSMSKTYVSDIYVDGVLFSSLGNSCKLLKCAEKEQGLGVDWCIVKDSNVVKNLTSSVLEKVKNEIRNNQPKDFGSASVSILYEKNCKKYMIRGVRQSLKSDSKGYTFTLKLSDSLETQKDNIPHTNPSMNNEHFHNTPRISIGDKIMKQSDLPDCIYLDTWVYKEYYGPIVGAAGYVLGGIISLVAGASFIPAGGCLGGSMQVDIIRENEKINIKLLDLLPGDKILTYKDGKYIYDSVYYIKDYEEKESKHKKIDFNDKTSIIATDDHIVYDNDQKLIPVSKLKINDTLFENKKITEITIVNDIPLNPMTFNGNIVINGVLTCCYPDNEMFDSIKKLNEIICLIQDHISIERLNKIADNLYNDIRKERFTKTSDIDLINLLSEYFNDSETNMLNKILIPKIKVF